MRHVISAVGMTEHEASLRDRFYSLKNRKISKRKTFFLIFGHRDRNIIQVDRIIIQVEKIVLTRVV
ncbi:MAG: hypothetical protein DMF63_03085 [Acidobacteria bacterium]|nr:MAG: hypothetical protein DMF63_03085 [Acidobacteriota bacterium]